MQNIFIIGAGAIGRVLAVALGIHQRNVVLLRGSTPDQQRETRLIRVKTPGAQLEYPVVIDSLENHPVLDGIVVLTNKSFGNAALARALKCKTGDSPVVLLQNGLEVEMPFLQEGFTDLYRCVLFATSQFADDGGLRFKPVAPSPVGAIRGSGARLADLTAQLDTPVFPFRAERNMQPIIWKKAIANCVFNSICPLLETDNGLFHRNEKAMALARRVIGECVGVARAKGVEIGEEEVVDSVVTISQMSDGQLISTLQDIRHHRPTEIDTLNLAIAKMADDMQKAGEVSATRLLGELTRLKSEINL
ncbi:ketopantoate reductase family protein [Chitinophaga rhizosphaerae]|uniref:ketopantoate reductase family protein n=1 Tax=Chitinophaga rhizosphaerae TaxID=1864947 RepID=UPI000F80CD7D|nr:2-dehydropantoate 2-reductase [Chitinophaga rhizosphaerae]